MKGFGHFSSEVPEIRRAGWTAIGTLMLMTKTELHELVDALPDESLPAAAILLRRAQDPIAAKLDAAPYDDEELTDEDLRAVKEARGEPGISWSDAEAELNAG
jgi:hypothetical protein